MLTFEIIVTEEEIEFSAEGEAILLRDARAALEAQALSGKDRDGNPIKGKGGKTLDLHETGAMWRNVSESVAEDGLIFHEEYARVVLAKYKADALSPENQTKLDEKLTPLLDSHVTNKEVK